MVSLTKNILSAEATAGACASIESASWIWHPDLPKYRPGVVQFAIDITADDSPLVFHISADQRFKLCIDDGLEIRGPDCSDPAHWPFATYEVILTPGKHRVTATVWWIGQHAPVARMTVEGGFILKAEGAYHEKLTTGVTQWKATVCPEYSFVPWEIKDYQSVGDQVCIDNTVGPPPPETYATVIAPAGHKAIHGLYFNKWQLTPTTLPNQISVLTSLGKIRAVTDSRLTPEVKIDTAFLQHPLIPSLQKVLEGNDSVTIPANSCISVLCDMEEYYCGYPKLMLSGGKEAVITCGWAEALYERDLTRKGADRNQVEGLHFSGITDRFISNGGKKQVFETHWWRAGRYILVTFSTKTEPLTVHSLRIEETRYPLENDSWFTCDDPSINSLESICFRGLQTHSHEIATDSPYYEQMMYTGDNRLQALIRYVTSRDDRLTRQCIRLFNWSRASSCNGLTTARYPDRSNQWIPGFSLIWIWMVHDFYYWRSDHAFVTEQLLATRSILNTFSTFLNADQLLEKIPFWTFVDWTNDWHEGYPPGARDGISSLLNLQYILTLEKAMELESALGNQGQSEIYREQRDATAAAVGRTFWNEQRGLMADDVSHEHYSEHAQALTALCNAFDTETKRKSASALRDRTPGLTPASIYFSFYVFEAMCLMDTCVDSLSERLEPWRDLSRQGFKTPPEVFGESRSDCHAWGSHPLFHLHANVLGVRPASPGFREVSVSPKFAGWNNISGSMPHPDGDIQTSFTFSANKLEGKVELPSGITGIIKWKDKEQPLTSGTTNISLSC